MWMPRRGLILLAFLVPSTALTGLAIVLALKIVKRGPKDYRSAEVTGDGRGIRIDLDDYTKAPGEFGVFDPATGSHTKVAEVTRLDEHQRYVERRIDPQSSVPKKLGPLVDWTPDVFFEPSSMSRRYEEVNVDTDYGVAPAWLFERGDSDVWVIHIHGSWTDRSIMFRDVQAFSPLGFTSLVPSFRSDPDVRPAQPEVNHLGQTEWRDVDSAVDYAVAHGAQRIILSGWSLGGTIALLTAERSAHREKIVGIVLVGPVTSWRRAITAGAARAGVPAVGAKLAMGLMQVPVFAKMIGLEEAINFDALEWIDIPHRLSIPTLVLHSEADQEIPWEISVAFEQANPGVVSLIALPQAHHTQEWNAAPQAFTGELSNWVHNLIPTDPT